MPNEEHIDCPDFTAVIRLPCLMLVQILHDFVYLEEFLCRGAMEGFLYHVIVIFLSQPDADGNGEPELFHFLRPYRADSGVPPAAWQISYFPY